MTAVPIYIAGQGIVSSLGDDVLETVHRLETGKPGLGPLTLFKTPQEKAPIVGEAILPAANATLPRTHQLARTAAGQALANQPPPDAIVVGSTTGGIFTTESLLAQGNKDPENYRLHGVVTVAEDLAVLSGCAGPLIAVSTACSSGAVAIKLAIQMLRNGMATRVLAGGADSLCRLTYFGFKSLQLTDPLGARPFDAGRKGMSVAEGAAFVLLSTEKPAGNAVQVIGAGLSCDAYHATTPHPQGLGALAAMQAALVDAGVAPSAIDYINLHGTGTLDNDVAEARAVDSLFGADKPLLSSTKGATGHTLAAAGAMEAVIAAQSIQRQLIPANTGLETIAPDLNINPVREPFTGPVHTVLSNSFGFGGNNAALILSDGSTGEKQTQPANRTGVPLSVKGYACLTGAGHTEASLTTFFEGRSCAGCLPAGDLAEGLPPRSIRRIKRLPVMALALASRASSPLPESLKPSAISFGTGWGALSETYDFLTRLFETDLAFPSPTDFIGSVHNAPAGQMAMMLEARGANVTTSGGDYSFEQALLAATLTALDSADPILVTGADEWHAELSALFDPSVRQDSTHADGGGAVVLQRAGRDQGPFLALLDYRADPSGQGISEIVDRIGGIRKAGQAFGAILAGLPAAHGTQAEHQLREFLQKSGFDGPVIHYRRWIGEFASASAVATVFALGMVSDDIVPGPLCGGADVPLKGKGILVLGLGPYISAIGVRP